MAKKHKAADFKQLMALASKSESVQASSSKNGSVKESKSREEDSDGHRSDSNESFLDQMHNQDKSKKLTVHGKPFCIFSFLKFTFGWGQIH